jgi:hypothetical protein
VPAACETADLSSESRSSEDSESPEDNITTITSTDIEKTSEVSALSVPLTRLSVSPDFNIESMDIPYLEHIFYDTPKRHPYAAVFPQFVPDLMQIASSFAPLCHSMISIGAIITDASLRRPLIRALLHHQISLRQVQALLSVPDIEETTIYAVMMLAYFNIYSGRFLSARRHIRGLSLLLELYSAKGRPLSSVTMLIWRCAIRLDYYISSICPCKPIFPTPPVEQENLHRIWIHNAVTTTGEEWALAQFALDNLQLRASHLNWLAYQSRHNGHPGESEIQDSCGILLNDFAEWRSRKLFQEEDGVEESARNYQSGEVETFLDHPPLVFRNRFYANLLNEFRCGVLFVTFIASPMISQPSPYDAVRKIHAIDSCRAMIGTGMIKYDLPTVRILQFAGLVFADPTKYSEERAWIVRQLDRAIGQGNQAAGRVKEMLNTVWDSTYPWTYGDTEKLIQNREELERLELEAAYEDVGP